MSDTTPTPEERCAWCGNDHSAPDADVVEAGMRAYFAHHGWPDGTAPDDQVERLMRGKGTFYYQQTERHVRATIRAALAAGADQ